MRFPVYPERIRRPARFILKMRYILLAMLIVGPVVFFYGAKRSSDAMMFAGLIAGILGSMIILTVSASNAMTMVDIRKDGIYILDGNGRAYQHTSYRYVRNIEVRDIRITDVSGSWSSCRNGATGFEVRLIMAYVNGADCFEDLGLTPCSLWDKSLYWREEVLHHHNCVALVYSEAAWELLNRHLTAYAVS